MMKLGLLFLVQLKSHIYKEVVRDDWIDLLINFNILFIMLSYFFKIFIIFIFFKLRKLNVINEK